MNVVKRLGVVTHIVELILIEVIEGVVIAF